MRSLVLVPLAALVVAGCPAASGQWKDDAGWTWIDVAEHEGPPYNGVEVPIDGADWTTLGTRRTRLMSFNSPSGQRAPFPRRQVATGRLRDDFIVYLGAEPDGGILDHRSKAWYLGDRVSGAAQKLACPSFSAPVSWSRAPSYAFWPRADEAAGFAADALALVCHLNHPYEREYVVFQLRVVGTRSTFVGDELVETARLDWVQGPDGEPLALWRGSDERQWSADLERYAARFVAAERQAAKDKEERARKTADEARVAKERAERDAKQPFLAGRYCVAWAYVKPYATIVVADLTVTRIVTRGEVHQALQTELEQRIADTPHGAEYKLDWTRSLDQSLGSHYFATTHRPCREDAYSIRTAIGKGTGAVKEFIFTYP